MRITNEIRTQVLKALAKKVFQRKLDVIAESMVNLIDAIATEYHSDEHNRAIALGMENEDLLITIDRRFIIENFKFSVSGFNALNKDAFNTNRWGRVRSKELRFFTSRAKSHIYELTAADRDIKRLKKLVDQFESLRDEYDTFISDLNTILKACTTKKKLIELLPEAESHLPVQPKKLPLPTDTAESLRKKLRSAA